MENIKELDKFFQVQRDTEGGMYDNRRILYKYVFFQSTGKISGKADQSSPQITEAI